LKEVKTDLVLNEDIEIHFLELPKLKSEDITINRRLLKWLLFLKADTHDGMEEIAMNKRSIQKAIDVLEFFKRDRQLVELYEMREKALMDEVSALAGA
jgi:predicted transposase/invertase (TIGR01784 family)